jgi:GxxExxY protein
MKAKMFEPIPSEVEQAAKIVVDAAFQVHKELGPGLLKSVYETCMVYELRQRGIKVETQVVLPITYNGVCLEAGLRLDMVVENSIIVELKAVENTIPLFDAQLLTYLKLTLRRLGLLINFNVPLIKDGIKRFVV